MNGAKEIDCSQLKGKRMICLDNMSEDELWIGCANSHEWNWSLSKKCVKLDNTYTLFEIYFSRFLGGHSGRDINKKRGNPIILIGKLLKELNLYTDIYIKNINGGTRLNVIPIRCKSEIYIKNSDIDRARKIFGEYKASILKSELENINKLRLQIEKIEEKDYISLDKFNTKSIIDFITQFPNGVYKTDNKNNVIVSSNLGVIGTDEKEIVFDFSVRSNKDELDSVVISDISKLKDKFGLFEKQYMKLDGYEHSKRSNFIDLCKNKYRMVFNKRPKLINVHVGLEAGFFCKKIEKLDFIAIAPNIYNAHSPNEMCSITSIKNVLKYLIEILRSL